MVNLIIISDSPKTEFIESFLRKTIKAKIEVMADIDQALHDVFVKRPTVVCIQNRITDVNAEDVARHIKMLLGKGTPSFILMHEGDGNAKPVAGLFEHLLDLTLPEAKLTIALATALEAVLGKEWEQVSLSSPPQESEPFETTAIMPQSPHEPADTEEYDPFVLVNSLDEFMTTMPEDNCLPPWNRVAPNDAPGAAAPDDSALSGQLFAEAGIPDQGAASAPPSREALAAPFESKATTPSSSIPSVPGAGSGQQDKRPAPKPAPGVTPPSPPQTPSEFRITATAPAAARREQNVVPPILENFARAERKWPRNAGIALGIVACAVAWYMARQKPSAQTAVPLPPPVRSAVHKAVSSVRPPSGNAAAPSSGLPAFIPANGRDNAYALRNPGWERYAGTDYECRVFRENKRIKAIQVLATDRRSLDENLLKKALAELVGNDHYQVLSRERVKGYLIVRGSIVGKADLILYNQDAKLHAFVLSLN